MKIHEYQAKVVLAKYGVPVPKGGVAFTPEQARQRAEELGGPVVVKAQIHAGGRGKGGGVKLAKDAAEAEAVAGQIIGMQLVTHQTGPSGKKVEKVLVEEAMEIARELYLGAVIDRSSEKPVVMVSEAGGIEIEEVAARSPEKILREVVDPAVGLRPFQARKLAFGLHLPSELISQGVAFVTNLYRAFEQEDYSLAEINPLVVTGDGRLLALDAKMNFDDNALFRHKDAAEMRDITEESPLEVEASRFDLNYIKLDGNIGCMVNGAGLAMATMDIIKLAGAEPANFLDVGGGADVEGIKNAFRILVSDESVQGVLINIFGGILRCDRLAQGVVEASRELDVRFPMVVRMEGTNMEEGQRILKESGLNFSVATGMKDAAEKIVEAVKK